jgi:uncharacterized membrane protein
MVEQPEWTSIAEGVHVVGIAIEVMAVLVIAYGALEAFAALVGLLLKREPLEQGRTYWLRFLLFLVVGLTFQLAADLVHIAIAQGWEPIGRVAVIAMLRTFLSYFLNRDLQEFREKAHAPAG